MPDLKICISNDNTLEELFVKRWNTFVTEEAKKRGLNSEDYTLNVTGVDKISRAGCKSILMTEFVANHLAVILESEYFKKLDKKNAIRKIAATPREYYFKSRSDNRIPEKGTFLKKVCKDLDLSFNLSCSTISNFYSEKKGGTFYNIDLYCISVYNDVTINFHEHLKRIIGKEELVKSDFDQFFLNQEKDLFYDKNTFKEYIENCSPPRKKVDTNTSLKVIDLKETIDTNTNNIKKHTFRIYPIIGILVLLCGIAIILIKHQSRKATLFLEKEKIIKLIHTCHRLEFSAYKGIPRHISCSDSISYSESCYHKCVDTLRFGYKPYLDSLKTLMYKEPYHIIHDIVGGSALRGWTLRNPENISAANLLSIDVEFISDRTASVVTQESWRIDWFETAINQYIYKYDISGKQIYRLKRDFNGKWKIYDNKYKPELDRQPPPLILCCQIKDELVDKMTIKQKAISAAQKHNPELALTYIKCYEINEGKSVPQKISEFNTKLKYLYQGVNTGFIPRDEFINSKIELTSEITDWLNKY